jgi:hypothetical protein
MIGIEKPTLSWLSDDVERNDVDERVLELYRRELINAWAGLLSSDEGRLIAWSILDKCHVFSSTYTGNAASNFLEGERNVGLKVLKEHILPLGPQTLATMMEEAEDRFDRLRAVAEAQIKGEKHED